MPFDFPASPTNGQQVTGANGVVWIWDGVKWVASTAGNPFPVAPTPPVGDNDTSVATTAFVQAAVSTALHDVGRNFVHNAGFTVAQRGAGPWTTNGYTLDRWQIAASGGDTFSVSRAAATDPIRAAIGDEAVSSLFANAVVGTAAAGAFIQLQQPIEGVRRLAGKTVTLSFTANALAGTPKIGINYLQAFGTGGSPSSAVYANATGQSVTLSTTWTRYSVTTTIPSVSGKTLGTNGDDSLYLLLWYSSGATNNAAAGNIGVQSGTMYIWGVQLEIGSVATPLEKRDPVYEAQQCQRFYVGNSAPMTFAFNAWAASAFQSLPIYFPVPMRAAPTVITGAGTSNTNVGSVAVLSANSMWAFVNAVSQAAGGTGITIAGYTASADL